MKTTELDDLCENLMILKKEEKAIADVRIATENEIANLVATKDEGTDKAATDKFKVTVTSKLTRTLDYPAYLAVETSIPLHLRPVVMKPDIALKVLRQLEATNPDIPAGFITTKPAKSQVKVEVI